MYNVIRLHILEKIIVIHPIDEFCEIKVKLAVPSYLVHVMYTFIRPYINKKINKFLKIHGC